MAPNPSLSGLGLLAFLTLQSTIVTSRPLFCENPVLARVLIACKEAQPTREPECLYEAWGAWRPQKYVSRESSNVTCNGDVRPLLMQRNRKLLHEQQNCILTEEKEECK